MVVMVVVMGMVLRCSSEKVKEITSWLKTHPVADIARASCDLQILDKAIVERIEEEVVKAKVTRWGGRQSFSCSVRQSSLCRSFVIYLLLLLSPSFTVSD